jgi:hypothetical protein
MKDKVNVPVGRIIRLVTKAVRYSKGGFTKAERRDLGLDLLELAAALLDDILDDPQEALFDAVDRPDALR